MFEFFTSIDTINTFCALYKDQVTTRSGGRPLLLVLEQKDGYMSLHIEGGFTSSSSATLVQSEGRLIVAHHSGSKKHTLCANLFCKQVNENKITLYKR